MALWSRREHKTRILLDILLRAQVSQRGRGCQTQLLWCWCLCTPMCEIDLHPWYLLPKYYKKIRLVKVILSKQMICSTTRPLTYVHSVLNWVTNRVLRLVWVTIFSKIQTSDGHYSCIISLENNTIIGHYSSSKLNSMIEIPHRSKV